MTRGLIGGGDKYIPYNPKLKDRSRDLRKNMTMAEKRLWYNYLQGNKINFTRQKPIDHFIVDFYCPTAKLVIEIDGDSHFSENGKIYDAERTSILKSHGLEVLRFTNQEVMKNLEDVIKKIDEKVKQGTENPLPL